MTVRGVEVERRGPVGWVLINDYQATVEAGASDPDYIGVHEGIGMALDELRWDESIRIVVITGKNDGEFYRFARRTHWDDPKFRDRLNPIKAAKSTVRDFQGGGLGAAAVPQASQTPKGRRPAAHEMLMLIEKPVIARVNGDAIGFGTSLLWGSDLIVAREDALIAWGMTGLGEIVDSNGERRGFPETLTPSYGMSSIMYMPPSKVKEFMMLSKVYTGKELAAMNAINYAVPTEQLDAVVDDLIQQLLRRSAVTLAHTKELCNKHLMHEYILAESLAGAYGSLEMWLNAGAEEIKGT